MTSVAFGAWSSARTRRPVEQGWLGEQDLVEGTRSALANQDYQYQTFKHPIAFNLIPQIGSAKHQGYTSEEMKMVWETQKIFGDDSIQVCPDLCSRSGGELPQREYSGGDGEEDFGAAGPRLV